MATSRLMRKQPSRGDDQIDSLRQTTQYPLCPLYLLHEDGDQGLRGQKRVYCVLCVGKRLQGNLQETRHERLGWVLQGLPKAANGSAQHPCFKVALSQKRTQQTIY